MNKKNQELRKEIRDKKVKEFKENNKPPFVEEFEKQAEPIVDAFSTIIKNQRELDKKIVDMFKN